MKEVYWNLSQVLEWISCRSIDLANDLRGGEQDSLGYIFSEIFRRKDATEARLDNLSVLEQRREKTKQSILELEQAIESGALKNIKAFKAGTQAYEKIKPRYVEILLGSLYAEIKEILPDRREVFWSSPLFSKQEIMQRWPKSPISAPAKRPIQKDLDNIIEKIINDYEKNEEKINKTVLYKEINNRLTGTDTKVSAREAQNLMAKIPLHLKKKRGERGKNK